MLPPNNFSYVQPPMVSLGVPGAGACGASAGATLTLEELALLDAPADRRRFFHGLSMFIHHGRIPSFFTCPNGTC